MQSRLLFALFGGLVFLFFGIGALSLNSRCKVCILAGREETFGVHFAG